MANPTLFGIDLYDLLFFLGLLLFTLALARTGYALVRRVLDQRVGKRGSKVTANLVQYGVLSLGVGYGVLNVLHLDMTALAASLGLVSIAVAFSSQQIIQNFMAGLIIALDRRIQLEDWIEVAVEPNNRPARVTDITLTRTMLRDVNGRLITIPNSMMVTNSVVNYTQSGFVEVVIPFPLPPGADREKIRALIIQVLEEHEKVLPNVKGAELSALQRVLVVSRIKQHLSSRLNVQQFMPSVLVQEVTLLRVNLSIRFWIREIQLRERIVSEILAEILDRLEAQGIKPY